MLLALTGYEIGLLVVALVFIAFALVVALVVPRSRPDFPANRLAIFIGICIVLFLAQMGAVFALAELGEGEEAEAGGEPPVTLPTDTTLTETEPEQTLPTDTTLTETTTTETLATDTTLTETGPASEGDAAAGKQVFIANCGTCHTLADAGTTGTIGPNLDAAMPSHELAIDRVTNGQGVMPSFTGTLSEEQIANVAAYVSSVAGS